MKIRLCELNVHNFKNISKGTIVFPYGKRARLSYPEGAEIIGIYGQNGSGKSTIVEVLDVLQSLMSGKTLPSDTYDLLTENQTNASIECKYLWDNHGVEIYFSYEVQFQKEEGNVNIVAEKLRISQKIGDGWSAIRTALSFGIETGYGPDKYFRIKKREVYDKVVEMKILAKTNRSSYLFHPFMMKYLAGYEKPSILPTLLDSVSWYANTHFIVIKNDITGDINSKTYMPFYAHLQAENGWILYGDTKLQMCGTSVIEKKLFEYVTGIIEQINIVLNSIVPMVQIELISHGYQLLEDGSEGIQVELISRHNNNKIPFRMESDGIKKITSILSALIAMYNDDTVLLAIDELDAGIYEYLLGELIEILQDRGKGQLLFTSHNLILLEKLSKNSIYFTTTDSQDRFMQFHYVKSNNNLRDLYLRTIELGGQDKEIYEETSSARMNRAFRKAGEYVYGEKKD